MKIVNKEFFFFTFSRKVSLSFVHHKRSQNKLRFADDPSRLHFAAMTFVRAKHRQIFFRNFSTFYINSNRHFCYQYDYMYIVLNNT